MAEIITVARPYAVAVFRHAKESNTLQAWSDALAVLASVAQDEAAQEFAASPKHTPAEVQKLLVEVLGAKASDVVKNFVAAILENRRFKALPKIAELFELFKAAEEGMVEAEIETAFEMADAQLAGLVANLEARFKRKIAPVVTVNAALIGGIKVTVGDEVIDASVRGKLGALATSLKS